jgi:hypothetical protein
MFASNDRVGAAASMIMGNGVFCDGCVNHGFHFDVNFFQEEDCFAMAKMDCSLNKLRS